MNSVNGNKKIDRRSVLRLGAAAGAVASAGAVEVAVNSVGTRAVASAAPNQAPFPFTGLTSGLVVTDLEVVTVTDTSVTFSWATYAGPHPAWGKLAPLAPADTEVALVPVGADEGGELPVVLSLIHISEPTRRHHVSRMPSSA